jgi:hypothetical protein
MSSSDSRPGEPAEVRPEAVDPETSGAEAPVTDDADVAVRTSLGVDTDVNEPSALRAAREAPPEPPDPASEALANELDTSEGPSSAPPTPAELGAYRRDRIKGFSIILVAFTAALIISWKSSEAVRPRIAATPDPPTVEGLAGYPTSVDPLATLAVARGLTERTQLRRIVAAGVAADGTVDLTNPRSSIRYEFDSARGEGPEAPRPAGTVPRARHCGRQTVHLKKTGIYASVDRPQSACRPRWGAPLPDPRCSLSQLWALAIERNAPADAQATIDYFRAEEGPAWRFSIQGSRVRFTVYGDCETELKGKAARPLAP